ncbi:MULTISPECIES: DUF927 domain-containing protein [Brevibacillus]|uniref:DUF927 domain-containing protein n=1 Tax=Brevibacillus TaxID=55080 RepID=UPI001C8EBBF3|nr:MULTISPECIES: DUF927 domain-containing protein [Brevibacillus]MBY0051967.1 DUF927 domain-containing protein [Brevibacillus agri]MDH4617983.1 DUF927 domain-containing protein [Brevibacillus sp. AY1]
MSNPMTGMQQSRFMTKDGVLYVGDLPIGRDIRVIALQTNLDTNEVGIVLEFEDNGKKIRRRISRSDLTKPGLVKLTRYGADTWGEVVEHYVDYLREQVETMPRTYVHSMVGWDEFEGQLFFKHYKAVGLNSIYVGSQHDIEPKGSYDKWFALVEAEVLGNPWLEFALVVGFTAALVSLIGKKVHIDSLFFNFAGKTTSGKTTSTRLGLSPWGLPDSRDNGLLKLWFGTDQGILSNLTGNFGIPIGIDDTSLQEKDKDYTALIYRLVVGKEKQALNADGTIRQRGEWNTTIISSSELSMFNGTDQRAGLRVRLTEVEAPYWTSSAENAERIERGVLENYGHAGPRFVEYLMENYTVDQLVAEWELAKDLLLKYMEKDRLSARIAGKLAIVLLTGKLVRKALGLALDLEQLAKTLLYIEKKSVESRDVGDAAYRYLIEFFMRNQSKFFEDKGKKGLVQRGECLGKYLTNGDTVTEIRIPKEGNFAKVMADGKFTDLESIIESWKQKDLLVCDVGKNYVNRVFEKGMPRVPLYAIKVIELEEDTPESFEVVFGNDMLAFLADEDVAYEEIGSEEAENKDFGYDEVAHEDDSEEDAPYEETGDEEAYEETYDDETEYEVDPDDEYEEEEQEDYENIA